MASFKRRPDGTWYVRWSETDPVTGKRRQPQSPARLRFRTRAQAESWWAQKRLEIDRRGGLSAPEMTVEHLMQLHLSDYKHRVRPSTYEAASGHVRRHIVPHLGAIRLERLTPAVIREWHGKLRDAGLARSTIIGIHSTLSRALRQAEADGTIPRNPARHAWPEGTHEHRRNFLDMDELHRFLDVTTPEDTTQLMWRMALMTGMRSGELLGLQWRYVDLTRGTVRVEYALSKVAGQPWRLTPPKTARARRLITLPQLARDELAAHRRAQVKLRLAMGSEWQDHDLVFATRYGTPLARQNVYDRLKWFCYRQGFERISMHTLRRSHATWLAALGEHPSVVQHRLGHTTSRITLDIYTQVSEGMDRHASGLLDGWLDGDDELDVRES